MKGQKQGIAGSSLIQTFIVVFMLVMIAASLVSVLTYQSRYSLQRFYSTCAFDLARAGLARAKLELFNSDSWGSPGPVSISDEQGSIEISVKPQPGGFTSPVKCWKITSTGRHYGANASNINGTRTLTAWIKQESSLEYLCWTDSVNPGGDAWLLKNETFNGPMHTNGYFSIAGKPSFSVPLTSGNIADPFYDAAAGSYSINGTIYTDNRCFYHCYSSMSLDMPIDAKKKTGPCLNGASLIARFPSFDTNWKNQAQFTYPDGVDITILASGKLLVKDGKKEESISSNSTVYVSGKATLRGKVTGKPIIITEGDVTIDDSISYKDPAIDFLAVVSGGSIILDAPLTAKNVSLDGYYAATGGSLIVKNYNSGAPRGTLTLFGGLLEKYSSPVSTFASNDYSIESGFQRAYTYDPRLLSVPSWCPSARFMKTLSVRDDQLSR